MASILEIYEKKVVFGVEVAYCALNIQKRVLGYVNVEIGQEVAQGKKMMLDKCSNMNSLQKGLCLEHLDHHTSHKTKDEQYVEMSGFHASEHVIIEGSAMITGGASQDLGGISLGSFGINICL